MLDDMLDNFKDVPKSKSLYWLTYTEGVWSAGVETFNGGQWVTKTVHGNTIDEVKCKLQQPHSQREKLIREVSKLF